MDMAKRSVSMVPNCPCCKDWMSETRGRITVCRFSDGTVHAAPDMWIGARASRIEAENPGMSVMDAFAWAWKQWAWNCEQQAKFDAQAA